MTALLLLTALPALSACLAERADWDFGVSTSEIVGRIDIQGPPVPPRDVLIVVYRTHYLFATQETGERIYRTSATLASMSPEGRYAVAMPSDVVRMELVFAAPDRLSDQFRFSRQVGIGQVTYRAVLVEDANWREHFYTFIQPTFSHLIVEPRYQLSPEHQQRLGDWLQAQGERLERRRAVREAVPPPGETDPMRPAVPPAAPQ